MYLMRQSIKLYRNKSFYQFFLFHIKVLEKYIERKEKITVFSMKWCLVVIPDYVITCQSNLYTCCTEIFIPFFEERLRNAS